MTQVYNQHNPQSRQQIFKSLGIDVSSPSTLMDNAMPVPAILSCTTIPSLSCTPQPIPRSPANLAVPAYSRYVWLCLWLPSPQFLVVTQAPISPSRPHRLAYPRRMVTTRPPFWPQARTGGALIQKDHSSAEARSRS